MITWRSVASKLPRPIRWPKLLRRAGLYLLVIVAMVPFMFPFVWMFLNSFKREMDAVAIPPVFIFTPSLQGYRAVMNASQPFHTYFINSVIVSVQSA